MIHSLWIVAREEGTRNLIRGDLDLATALRAALSRNVAVLEAHPQASAEK
jgi:hypothetical protein